MAIQFFRSSSEFRKWLAANHACKQELYVGFYKVDSGKPSLTWPQAVDQALAFGWIDGVRKRINEISYTIRFTPRKPKSIWSRVNIKRVSELTRLGLMAPEGIQAFVERDQKKTKLYSYENDDQKLDLPSEEKFKTNKKAWKYFQAQAPSYQKVACRWVMSAKQAQTKSKRLAVLIEDSENGKHLGFTTKWGKK